MVGKNPTDTVNLKVGQDQQKEISTSGEAEVTMSSTIEPVEGPNFGDKIALEKFMNEVVEIHVYPPIGKGEEQVVQTAVNGVNQFIIRGVKQKVKRKYVEVLARARKNSVTADGYKDANGEARNTVNVIGGLQYPFQVLHDPNPNGPAWLRQIVSEN